MYLIVIIVEYLKVGLFVLNFWRAEKLGYSVEIKSNFFFKKYQYLYNLISYNGLNFLNLCYFVHTDLGKKL